MFSGYLKKKKQTKNSIKFESGAHFSTDTVESIQESYYCYSGLNQSLKPPETRDSKLE